MKKNEEKKTKQYKDDKRFLYIDDWEKGYEDFHYFKVFGKLKFSITYEDGITSVREIHTDIPDLIIKENGSDNKLWVETIVYAYKKTYKRSKGYIQKKYHKTIKWISWEENDTINKERYMVAYTQVQLTPYSTKDYYSKRKIIAGGQTIQDVFDILKFSKSVDEWSTYIDGSTYEGVRGNKLKHMYHNEDVVITNEKPETRNEVWEKRKQMKNMSFYGPYTGGSYYLKERMDTLEEESA